MATISEMRITFDGLPVAQKKPFILDLKKQAESSNSAELRQFYNECVRRYKAEVQTASPQGQQPIVDVAAQATATAKSGLNALTAQINKMAGESGSVDLRLRDLFSQVFKKHTRTESDEIFIAGTAHTTPKESDIVTSWPKPWLFSRILVALLLSSVLLYICAEMFGNPNVLPGLMFMGALAMPFSVLVFIFETNAPRNISFFEVLKMFFIGGTASLILTLILFEIFPSGDMDYLGAVIVGFVEEYGKLFAAIIFIRMLNPRYILNGMLIGAAIGAGFAVFETAGYAFRYFIGTRYSMDALLEILVLRGWSSVGAHVVWAAISGAALVMVKGDAPFRFGMIRDIRFFKFFIIPVVLHATWNSPLLRISDFWINIKMGILIIAAWVVLLVLLNVGLKQIQRK